MTVLTKLHAGGKFGGDGYKVSGGLHGVGVSVVNASPERLAAEVRRDGKGVPAGVRADPAGRRRDPGKVDKGDTGTTIHFLPDAEIFEEVDFDLDPRPAPARDGVPDARPPDRPLDEREGEERHEFHAEGGIRTSSRTSTTPRTCPQAHRLLRGRERRRRGRVAMQWNTSYVESVFSFANNINTHEAEPTSPGLSAPRLTGRSTGMRARRAC